jgi:probable F420-dependent oxidoreductase
MRTAPRRVGRIMTVELGRYGIWRRQHELDPDFATQAEELGYGAIWIGGSPPGDLELAEAMLAATGRLAIATGIVNMWSTPAEEVAASYRRIEARYPGRFLLGVGIGHPEATREYRSPYATMVDYLDRLDAAGVPVAGRALAALGPKALRLSADRTAGAHPYLTTPEHTREARTIMGEGVLLAPEQKVVVDTDAQRGRDVGRTAAEHPYLHLVNYRSNLQRLGWSEALIDALVAHGDAATVAARLTAHLDAGADHVCAQILPVDGDPLPALRALSQALHLR